eukprot:ANDGO_06344.mRNA.1 Pyridoxal kinase
MSVRVLSIQSHVVHGYVGNKAATLPLQLNGIEVDPVNTVHFSNHKGYPVCTGTVMDGAGLRTIIDGLRSNRFLSLYSGLLTGFIGSEAFLQSVVDVISELRSSQNSPQLLYLCDPVLGDDGKLYVPPQLVDQYKSLILPCANVVTPNHFEAETLSGFKITNTKSALDACNSLHQLGPELVVITSLDCAVDPGLFEETSAKKMVLLASNSCSKQRIFLQFDRIEGSFSGCGDLFASLLLAQLLKEIRNPTRSQGSLWEVIPVAVVLKRALAGMHLTMKVTAELGRKELALVQSQKYLSECDPRCVSIQEQILPFAS